MLTNRYPHPYLYSLRYMASWRISYEHHGFSNHTATRLFVPRHIPANIKEITKAPNRWPFVGQNHRWHYNDVIMAAMASPITSLTFVCSTVYSSLDQKKHQSSASLAFARGIHRWLVNSPHGNSPVTGEFPTQRASNAQNVSIWWRHHGPADFPTNGPKCENRFHVMTSLCEFKILAMSYPCPCRAVRNIGLFRTKSYVVIRFTDFHSKFCNAVVLKI